MSRDQFTRRLRLFHRVLFVWAILSVACFVAVIVLIIRALWRWA